LRIVSILYRGLLQQWRDPLTFSLTIFTTPLVIFFYWMFMDWSQDVRIGIFLPHNNANQIQSVIFEQIKTDIQKWQKKESSDLKIEFLDSNQFTIPPLSQNKYDILVKKSNSQNKDHLEFEIDVYSHSEAVQYSSLKLKEYLSDFLLNQNKIQIHLIQNKELQKKQTSAFALFVPGFLVFSILMIIFSTAMMFAFEIESHLILVYRLTKTSIFEYFLGSGSIQLINSILTISLSIILTSMLGYSFEGKMGTVFLVCLLGSLCSIGFGMIVASFTINSNQAFLSSSFIMFLLLIFSGILFPSPNLSFCLGENESINIFGFLPTSKTKQILDDLLFYSKSMKDIASDLQILILSTILILAGGILSFQRIYQKGDPS